MSGVQIRGGPLEWRGRIGGTWNLKFELLEKDGGVDSNRKFERIRLFLFGLVFTRDPI